MFIDVYRGFSMGERGGEGTRGRNRIDCLIALLLFCSLCKAANTTMRD